MSCTRAFCSVKLPFVGHLWVVQSLLQDRNSTYSWYLVFPPIQPQQCLLCLYAYRLYYFLYVHLVITYDIKSDLEINASNLICFLFYSQEIIYFWTNVTKDLETWHTLWPCNAGVAEISWGGRELNPSAVSFIGGVWRLRSSSALRADDTCSTCTSCICNIKG